MATEKFLENGRRSSDTVDIQSTAHFVNGVKSEADLKTDLSSNSNSNGGGNSPLPTPASASSPKPKYKLSAAAIIPIWIVLSSSVIIYNNYLYNTLNFRYPVFLVTFHLGFAVRASPSPPCLARASKTLLFGIIGSRHAPTPTDDAPPRWHEGHPPHKGHVYPLNPPHRPSFQRKPHP